MLLRRHNLNLLPILRELLRTRSVSRTAERVGLSQSAVSAALARLREIFDDDLLVVVGRHMELTPKGAALIEQTERAHAELETLFQPPAFDPAKETRRFVVASADYTTLLMAPRVATLMDEEAPLASVRFTDIQPGLVSEMLHGRVDAAIVPEGSEIDMPERNFARMALFQDETIVIASRRRRPFQGELTLEAYKGAQHAICQISPRADPRLATIGLRESGIEQHNLVLVQQFSALPAIVESTACLALLQRRLAERYQRHYAIDLFRPPFELPPLRICAFWALSAERDLAHRWFRELLLRARPEETQAPL
ncbi:MAG: LysR family transcriptional regulator [Caulobacterales bacterium]